MADIMRATTPINNRNIITPTKEHRDASALPFDFQDLSKIKTTNAQSEMLGQNNVLRENGSSATALFTMLRDPEVATSFLKNIFFLREIVGLMPLNNETQTEEMQQLLSRLILSPEEIAQEMINQENIATIFKGDLFDTLRKLLSANGKSVSENIAQKLSQVPLAQLGEGDELQKMANQPSANSQNTNQTQQTGQPQQAHPQQTQGQPAQNNQNTQTYNQPIQSMVEGFIAPAENPEGNQQPPQLFPNQNGENQPPQNQNGANNQNLFNNHTANTQRPEGSTYIPPEENSMGQMTQPQENIQQPQQTAQPQIEQPTANQFVPEEMMVGMQNTQNAEQNVLNQPATPEMSNQNRENQQTLNTENKQTQNPALNNTDKDFVRIVDNTGKQPVNITPKMPEENKVDISKLLENIKTENLENPVSPDKAVAQKDMQDSIINLLKAINSQHSRNDVLDAVKNNLEYLKDSFPDTSEYSENLETAAKNLESLINGTLPKSDFPQVKSQILSLLDSLQNSVLYDGEMAKTVGLAKYNLSRYNSNDNLIAEAFSKLLQNVPDKELQSKLVRELTKYLETAPTREASYESKTMSALTEILEKQSENLEAKMLNAESVDKIVHGLLSSPSNFTPLLHYVIPVDNGQTQAMAEIWINPNGEEDVEGGVNSGKKMTHMLVVFEIESIGKFETELYVEDKNITLSVMCPPEYVSKYKVVNADIRRACESTGYRFKSIEITQLKESRSLIDVFRSLPARRSGINVTI